MLVCIQSPVASPSYVAGFDKSQCQGGPAANTISLSVRTSSQKERERNLEPLRAQQCIGREELKRFVYRHGLPRKGGETWDVSSSGLMVLLRVRRRANAQSNDHPLEIEHQSTSTRSSKGPKGRKKLRSGLPSTHQRTFAHTRCTYRFFGYHLPQITFPMFIPSH